MLNQNQPKPILNRIQTEKVEVALNLIHETKEAVKQKDFHTAVLLGVAANNCKQVIENDLPEGYKKPCHVRVKVKYEPTTGVRILGVLGWIVGASFLSSALCACLSLGSFGLSEFKAASGWKDSNNYASVCRGYRGLSFTFLAIALTSGVLASVVGDAVNRGADE